MFAHFFPLESRFAMTSIFLRQLTLDCEWYETHWPSFHLQREDAEVAVDILKDGGINLMYLMDEQISVQAKPGGRHWKIYGSPRTPWYGGMAFNYQRGAEAERLHAKIPDDVDILLTHGPPFDLLDMTKSGDSAGCEELHERVKVLRPVLHVFGHIHESRGAEMLEWEGNDSTAASALSSKTSPQKKRSRTAFVNAANLPSGTRAWAGMRSGMTTGRSKAGDPGFQPIIVDLFDPVPLASLPTQP